MLLEDKLVAEKINEKSQEGIASSAGGIAEGLQRNKFSEGGIKEINKRDNQFFRHIPFMDLEAKIG